MRSCITSVYLSLSSSVSASSVGTEGVSSGEQPAAAGQGRRRPVLAAASRRWGCAQPRSASARADGAPRSPSSAVGGASGSASACFDCANIARRPGIVLGRRAAPPPACRPRTECAARRERAEAILALYLRSSQPMRSHGRDPRIARWRLCTAAGFWRRARSSRRSSYSLPLILLCSQLSTAI